MKHTVSIRNRKDPAGTDVNLWTHNNLNRVAIIKALRTATGLGLKEAKDLTDVIREKRSIDIEVKAVYGTTESALRGLREQGLDVERSLDDPISILRTAADEALAVDNVALAADILRLVVAHTRYE